MIGDTLGCDNAALCGQAYLPRFVEGSVGGSQAHSAPALAPGSHLPPALFAPLCDLLALFAADDSMKFGATIASARRVVNRSGELDGEAEVSWVLQDESRSL